MQGEGLELTGVRPAMQPDQLPPMIGEQPVRHHCLVEARMRHEDSCCVNYWGGEKGDPREKTQKKTEEHVDDVISCWWRPEKLCPIVSVCYVDVLVVLRYVVVLLWMGS